MKLEEDLGVTKSKSELGAIVSSFVNNLDVVRSSNDKYLRFACGDEYFPSTVGGIISLGKAKIKRKLNGRKGNS